jgi:hypothetical protein
METICVGFWKLVVRIMRHLSVLTVKLIPVLQIMVVRIQNWLLVQELSIRIICCGSLWSICVILFISDLIQDILPCFLELLGDSQRLRGRVSWLEVVTQNP